MGLSQPCKACSHDPEQNKLAVVVVPEGLTGTPSMLEGIVRIAAGAGS